MTRGAGVLSFGDCQCFTSVCSCPLRSSVSKDLRYLEVSNGKLYEYKTHLYSQINLSKHIFEHKKIHRNPPNRETCSFSWDRKLLNTFGTVGPTDRIGWANYRNRVKPSAVVRMKRLPMILTGCNDQISVEWYGYHWWGDHVYVFTREIDGRKHTSPPSVCPSVHFVTTSIRCHLYIYIYIGTRNVSLIAIEFRH